MPIPVMDVDRIPTYACMGYISEVGAVKETEVKEEGKPNYYMIPLTITPFEMGRKKVVNFMFRPEWLVQGFNPSKDIAETWGEMAKGPLFVAKRLFGDRDTIGTITGLAGGSVDAGNQLYDSLVEVAKENQDNVGPAVQSLLTDQLVSDGEDGKVIGYIVSQRSKRIHNEDTDKWETVFENQTDVSGWWEVTEKSKRDMERRASKKKDGMFRISWAVE